MAASATASYSLWLMPHHGEQDHPFNQRLQTEMALQAGTAADAPRFDPHVTLLGGIEGTEQDVMTKADELARHLVPYDIEFDQVGTGAFFFQCVLIKCKQTAPVTAAALKAREAFDIESDAPYFPHLSLLYSDISPEEKSAAASEAQQRLFGSGQGDQLPGGFRVDSLSVWKTPTEDKSLRSWELVATIPLEGGR